MSDPKSIQAVFSSLMKKDPDGLLKPEAVVEEAKKPDSPLHSRFEWDDSVAAHKYRVEQARQLIRSFKVYIPQLEIEVRSLTSLDMDRANGGGFRWTLEVLDRPDLRQQMIETALRELNILRKRYQHLEELDSIWNTIDLGITQLNAKIQDEGTDELGGSFRLHPNPA